MSSKVTALFVLSLFLPRLITEVGVTKDFPFGGF